MAKRNNAAKVDPGLKKAISEELKDIRAKEGEKFVVPLMDRMRIYNVALKLAAIEAKMDDAGFGTGFSTDTEDD